MTLIPPSSPPSSLPGSEVLRAVVAAFHALGARPAGAEVTAALLALEKSTKQARLPIGPTNLLGTWRLCFSADKRSRYHLGQPVGKGFYVPRWAIAHLSLVVNPDQPDQLCIANQLRVGPVHIHFSGPARYHAKRNLVAFDFTHLTLRCFGLPVYQGGFKRPQRGKSSFADTAIAQLPFFSFFAATDAYLAARGRGGGLALWIAESSQS